MKWILPLLLCLSGCHLLAEDIPAPDDVAAPPVTAQKTPSGLAYRVLKKGCKSAYMKIGLGRCSGNFKCMGSVFKIFLEDTTSPGRGSA